MISPDSRTKEWINYISKKFNAPDVALVEKTIRAFSLLEALARSGCPFVFKGGSCLMLHFNTEKRLSIDIDIVCPPGTNIKDFWDKYANDYGFEQPIEVIRESKTQHIDSAHTSEVRVPKEHAKYRYHVSYAEKAPEHILLDVLLEQHPYNDVKEIPIRSPFLKTEGEDVFVNVPSKSDILGDKLTAFAPNTTGIPYFKKDKNGNPLDCSLEIAKQMFDVACLIDSLDNFENVLDVYKKNVELELTYRNITGKDHNDALNDTRNTALCLGMRGLYEEEKYRLLCAGIRKLDSFIYGSRYSLEKAIADSAKVAYFSTSLQKGMFAPEKYAPNKIDQLIEAEIDSSLDTDLLKWTKLNKLKKTNIEAFYYWFRTFELLKS